MTVKIELFRARSEEVSVINGSPPVVLPTRLTHRDTENLDERHVCGHQVEDASFELLR